MIAHVGGLPVEETLPLLLSGAGGGLLIARAWVGSHIRRLPAGRQKGAGRSPVGRISTESPDAWTAVPVARHNPDRATGENSCALPELWGTGAAGCGVLRSMRGVARGGSHV